ncbi:hypothetical protein FOVG_19291 [Fusarium oxysporum f. sp. pisi HDV247]|uniref:Myb/SANT-like domain-containing protein n=1 Tax=Fusarium oxysporum f. sp. pisi HDV247 TaxID=1080344 RepID=W9NMT4_FUSOX|nr:hypothetical protein FOVG_19291 [Fusarium oxysporum f. sp. pisi HDV247]
MRVTAFPTRTEVIVTSDGRGRRLLLSTVNFDINIYKWTVKQALTLRNSVPNISQRQLRSIRVEEAGEGTHQESTPPATASASQNRNTRGWRWSDDQILYFLELLLAARRQGKLRITKNKHIYLVLTGFLQYFSRRWPEVQWTTRTLSNRLTLEKRFWRAFRDAVSRSETAFDEESARIITTEENQQLIIKRHGSEGRKVIRDGLLVSDSITYDSWEEIFNNDAVAGRRIHTARDDSFWRERSAERRERLEETADGRGDDSDNSFDDILPERRSEPSQETDTSVFTPVGDSEIDEIIVGGESQSQQRSQAPDNSQQRSSAPQGRRRSSGCGDNTAAPPPNSRTIATRKRKRTGDSWEEMKEILIQRDTKRKHTLVRRSEGSEDTELAIKDCIMIMEDRGRDVVLRIVSWISQDPINAVV